MNVLISGIKSSIEDLLNRSAPLLTTSCCLTITAMAIYMSAQHPMTLDISPAVTCQMVVQCELTRLACSKQRVL